MKNRIWLVAGSLAALLAAACNPYEKENKNPPHIVSVGVSDGATVTLGTLTGTKWSVTGASSTCSEPGSTASDQTFLFVTLDKLMDDATIQESTTDCSPAKGWLSVTPAAPAGKEWYSCYQPGSVSPSEGATIFIFLADARADKTCDGTDFVPAVPGANGWGGTSGPIPSSETVATTYTFKGAVQDRQGHSLQIDASAEFDPDAGSIDQILLTGSTASTLTLTWLDATCGAGYSYSIRKLNSAGDYVEIGNVPVGTTGETSFTDPDAAAGLNSYQIWTVLGAFEKEKAAVTDVTPSVGLAAAPTFGTVDNTGVVVNWTAVTGADSYDVMRAKDSGGAPGIYKRVAKQVTESGTPPALTYKDEAVTASGGPTYWYAIVPVKNITVGADTVPARGVIGPAASTSTPPAAPGAPTFTVTDTTVQVTWKSITGATAYDVSRATVTNSVVGNYTIVGPDVAAPTHSFLDPSVNPNTTYSYKVVAKNATGSSQDGTAASVTTAALPAPGAPSLTPTTTGVTVSWAAVGGAASYEVDRAADNTCGAPGAFAPVTTSFTGGTSFNDTVGPGTYWYRVIAKDSNGKRSMPSAAAGPVTTP